MRIECVYPAKDFVLYVEFEDDRLLKFDMSEIIRDDPEYFELKYYPEKFAQARVTNECRNISWGDLATLSGSIVEK